MLTKIFSKKYRIRIFSLIWWAKISLISAIFFGLLIMLTWIVG